MHLSWHQRLILEYLFPADFDILPFDTIIWSELKKSGKSALAAAVGRWWAETQEDYDEVYCCANDFEQAQGRNYAAIRRSIDLAKNPRYDATDEVRLNASAWTLTIRALRHQTTGTFIQALSGNYAGAAGGNPGMIIFSELWGYISEASRRLYGEMTTVPTRKNSFRWIETYAGWEGESLELERLYKLGMAGEPLVEGEFDKLRSPKGEPEVHVNKDAGLFMFWSHTPRQPWQLGERGKRYYTFQRANLRDGEYRRFHKNEWVAREGGFITYEEWAALPKDAIPLHELTARLAPKDKVSIILAGDASKNRDATALIGVIVKDDPVIKNRPHIYLCYVGIYEPAFDEAVEKTIVDLDETVGRDLYALEEDPRVEIITVAYDPYQLHSLMTTFEKTTRTDTVEIPQTERRVQTDTNLSDLIRQKRLHVWEHPQLREHVLNAVAIERARGIRLDKDSTSKHIDGVVALSMAAWAAMFHKPKRSRKFVKV